MKNSTDKKIKVGILGATGMVGQKFVELLSKHPWFEITGLYASEKSQGKTYGEAMKWMMPTPLPNAISQMIVSNASVDHCQLLFSGLDSHISGPIEKEFATKGHIVVSNTSAHRMDPSVPLVVPEVNDDHLAFIRKGTFGGYIVTNPNCSVIGLTLALKPIFDRFGIDKIHVVTLQAVSGAGYPGVPSFDILDNVIPYIVGEEEKVESEPKKIFGKWNDDHFALHSMTMSAQCNRVPVMDGHTGCVSVSLQKKASFEEIVESWNDFKGAPQKLDLPSAPKNPIVYTMDPFRPQPKLDRYVENGMSVSIGRLRTCSIFDWKFSLLSHNTIRGAAGCAILNAELLVAKGMI
jgi:aspartate-semialdehyde dehydrogenase